MKYILILMILVIGCEDHKRPTRNREKNPQTTHVDTVYVEPTSTDTFQVVVPDYFVILVDNKYFNTAAGLLDAAVADTADSTLNNNLWNYLARYYPEVNSNRWQLCRRGQIMYIKRIEE